MKTRRAIAIAVSAMLAVLATGAASPALAQTKVAQTKVDPEALKHFETANDLYKEGKYEDALVEYDAAYDASKNWKILYNRGQCLVMVRREPDAIASFRKYLEEGGDKVDAARKKQVTEDIAKLEERLGTITITGAPAGSIVEIDGHVVTALPPTKPIVAGAGNHEVTVRPPGTGIPSIQQIKVVAGKEVGITVSFSASTPTTAAASGGSIPPPPPQGMQPVDATPPPPPPPPHRDPGGFVAPSFLFALGLGGGVTTGNADTSTITTGAQSSARNARGVGLIDFGATWHPTPFWEIGLFAGGGSGAYSLKQDAVRSTIAGQTGDPSNVGYSYDIFGFRVRIHPIRARHFDGWLGFDIGRYGETWTASNNTVIQLNSTTSDTKVTGSALGIGLAFGADFPITRNWALGGAFRYLSATQVQCNGNKDNCPASGNDRGVSEFMLRLVFTLPYGSASESASASSSLKSGPAF